MSQGMTKRILHSLCSIAASFCLLPSMLSSCIGDGDAGNEHQQSTSEGILSLPLEATGSDGTVYRLIAEFEVMGTNEVYIFTGDAGETAINHALPVGEYTVTLVEGWRLMAETEDGLFSPASGATLLSGPSRRFSIAEGQVTEVVFSFEVDGASLSPAGTLRLSLAVQQRPASGGAGGTGNTDDACPDAGGATADGVPTLVMSLGSDVGLCTEGEVVAWLLAELNRRDPFVPLSWSDTADYAAAAERLISPGWSIRDQVPLSLVPPIDWATAQDGDSNWLLQLNSLRPALPFLFSAIADDSEVNRNRMLELALDWIDYNMPRDASWIEAGADFRAHVLSALLREILRETPNDVTSIRSLVWAVLDHGNWLADATNWTCSNHIFAMMLGLKTVCEVIPGYSKCPEWRDYCTWALQEYLSRAVSSEGISLEHSPGYHFYAASSLMKLRNTGIFDSELGATLPELLRNAVWMVHPNQTIVGIGDSEGDEESSGWHPYLDYASTDGTEGEEPPDAPIGFPEAGIAVLRSSWSEHPFEQHAFLFFAATYFSEVHKHADHMTFEWFDRGNPLIVDSGKYTYDRGEERDFFGNATRAANTVEIDGTDYPLEESARFGSGLQDWGQTQSGLQYLSGRVAHETLGVDHSRMLAMRPHEWLLVADWLDGGPAPHSYMQWFGFHDALELSSQDDNGLELVLPDGQALWARALTGVDGLRVVRGQETPELQGWISHQYGERVPRYSAGFSASGSDTLMVTLFGFDAPAEGVSVTQNPDSAEIGWTLGSGQEALRISRIAGVLGLEER